MRLPSLITLSAGALALAACSSNTPAPTPTPAAAPAAQTAAADDAAAAAKRKADEEAAARRRAEEESVRRRAEDEAARRAGADRERAERIRALKAELARHTNYDYNKADIRPEDAASLDRKIPILQANPDLKLKISGHADERGSEEYNLALGNRRALAAKRYAESKGIDGGRLETVSFGKERPVDPGHDETAWAKNRRAEFEIVSGDVTNIP
ncbi:MAG: OmpA family protein [Gemmatimonadales bacterium]|nr:OmpA family protein [Gemmatimonadales bacterium]